MAQGNQMGGGNKIASRKFKLRITENGMICNKCKKDVPLSEYGANKSWCLPCLRKNQNERNKRKVTKLW
tara:strand:+ start:485 stop:691 length:207 start_codon:yes stop_codon:yes gene_type:complete